MNDEKKLLDSIARKLGKDGLRYYFEKKELPAVKLSSEEMKFIQGGGLWKDFTGKTFKDWCQSKFDEATNRLF